MSSAARVFGMPLGTGTRYCSRMACGLKGVLIVALEGTRGKRVNDALDCLALVVNEAGTFLEVVAGAACDLEAVPIELGV